MRNTILVIACLLLSLQIKAQIIIEYSVNYGGYNMADMKAYLSDNLTSVLYIVPGLELATTDNFPSYLIHKFNAGYQMESHEFGLTGAYLTTAGKFSYADYSGKLSHQINVNGYRIGFFYRYYFEKFSLRNNRAISIFGELSPSMVSSKVKINQEVLPQNSLINSYSQSVNSADLSIFSGIGTLFEISDHIGLSFTIGYDINTSTAIPDLDNRKVEWSGFRIGIGARCRF